MRQTEQLLAFLNIVYAPNRLYIMHGAVFGFFFLRTSKRIKAPSGADVKVTAIK